MVTVAVKPTVSPSLTVLTVGVLTAASLLAPPLFQQDGTPLSLVDNLHDKCMCSDVYRFETIQGGPQLKGAWLSYIV